MVSDKSHTTVLLLQFKADVQVQQFLPEREKTFGSFERAM